MIMKKTVLSLLALILGMLVYGQSNSDIKCRIWKPASFHNYPDSVNLPINFKLEDTYEVSVSWRTLDANQTLKGVWITFPRSMGAEINLLDEFENISLINKASGATLHPIAILLPNMNDEGNAEKFIYLSPDTRAKKYQMKYGMKKKCDFIMIFRNADIGNKVIVGELLQTEIAK